MAKLTLVAAPTRVTTYHFRSVDTPQVEASCTINDQIAELLVTSDGQAWAHQWHPASLGVPTLTSFIAICGDIDYLARKLQGNSSGHQFSAVKTTAALQRKLSARRLADGREQIARRWDDEEIPPPIDRFERNGLPIFSWHAKPAPTWRCPERAEPLPYLTREVARRIWSSLDQLAGQVFTGTGDNADLFYSRLPSVEGFHDYVTEEPWHYAETVQTAEDKLLRESILPALVKACRATANLSRP